MLDVRQLLLASRLLRQGELGDGAVLKSDAVGAVAAPAVAARLQRVRGYVPPIDLDELAALPDGTFGAAYARHMRTNALVPLRVTERIPREMLERNVFAVRYAVTHDMIHLLLGFATDLPGEIGVLAFAVAQGYSRMQWLTLVIAAMLYPMLVPHRVFEVFAALRRGYRLGREAEFVLGERLEERFAEPLASVRRSLRLPDPDAQADVLQSA